MTRDDVLARFEREYQHFHRISAERCGQQRREIERLADAIEPRPLTEVDGQDFRAHMGALLDAGLHVNTVRKRANMLRSFFGWMYAADLIDGSRYMKLKSVKDPRGASGRSTPKPYTTAEIAQMWETFDRRFEPRVKNLDRVIRWWVAGQRPWTRTLTRHAMRLQIEAVIMLALHSGLRRGEIYQCSLDDLHYDNLYIVVRHGHNGTGDGRTRQVPYTPEAREAVRQWIEFRTLMRPEHNRPWLTIHRYNGSERNDALSFRAFESILSPLGPGWELHRLRHTCATERLRSGMPLEKLKELLGHANIQQTLAYAQILKSDIYRDLEQTNDSFVRRVSRRRAAA